jgi:hypothetical protein
MTVCESKFWMTGGLCQLSPAQQSDAFLEPSLHGRRLRDDNDRDALDWIAQNIRMGLWRYDPELAILKTQNGWRVKVFGDLRFDPTQI